MKSVVGRQHVRSSFGRRAVGGLKGCVEISRDRLLIISKEMTDDNRGADSVHPGSIDGEGEGSSGDVMPRVSRHVIPLPLLPKRIFVTSFPGCDS